MVIRIIKEYNLLEPIPAPAPAPTKSIPSPEADSSLNTLKVEKSEGEVSSNSSSSPGSSHPTIPLEDQLNELMATEINNLPDNTPLSDMMTRSQTNLDIPNPVIHPFIHEKYENTKSDAVVFDQQKEILSETRHETQKLPTDKKKQLKVLVQYLLQATPSETEAIATSRHYNVQDMLSQTKGQNSTQSDLKMKSISKMENKLKNLLSNLAKQKQMKKIGSNE